MVAERHQLVAAHLVLPPRGGEAAAGLERLQDGHDGGRVEVTAGGRDAVVLIVLVRGGELGSQHCGQLGDVQRALQGSCQRKARVSSSFSRAPSSSRARMRLALSRSKQTSSSLGCYQGEGEGAQLGASLLRGLPADLADLLCHTHSRQEDRKSKGSEHCPVSLI